MQLTKHKFNKLVKFARESPPSLDSLALAIYQNVSRKSRNMDITYTSEINDIDWNEVSSIFGTVDWGDRPADLVESAFKKSSFVRFAFDQGKLIGFGRTVDDGEFYGWVVDLIIKPEYQGNGIGTHIVKALEKDLESYVTTMLTAAPGKSGFYEKLGWVKQTASYIWPRTKGQSQSFT